MEEYSREGRRGKVEEYSREGRRGEVEQEKEKREGEERSK